MYCTNCGLANNDGNVFCIRCGTRLAGGAPATPATPSAAPVPVSVSLVRASTGQSYEVTEFPSVIGKGSAATVRIDGNNTISRKHVRIAFRDGALVVEELGATNNTYLNGERLVVGGVARLSDGDQLQLAEETFSVIVH